MFRQLLFPSRPVSAPCQPVALSSIPPTVFADVIRRLPDARSTHLPQARIVDLAGLGQVRLWFERRVQPASIIQGLGPTNQPYWRFSRAEQIPQEDAQSNPSARRRVDNAAKSRFRRPPSPLGTWTVLGDDTRTLAGASD